MRGSNPPSCPECDGVDLERRFSLPTVHSTGTHDKAMRAAKKRDARQSETRTKAQREDELHHDDH